MPRRNGSLIGVDANPNANVASGIWTVREAETYLRANKWPATPTVPGAPTGTAGNGQVALTWTAPTGGSTVTDYEVQYSSNGGSSWTTFSDGVSTATSATVTGLTNGTGYIFRVRAVNILGEGPYGSASGTITPAALDVSLLLHFDGSNGSTTFTDSSSAARAATAYGSAEISTSQSKFGGASAAFNGSSGVTFDGTLGLEGDPFAVEAWAYLTETSGYHSVLSTRDDGNVGSSFGIDPDGKMVCYSHTVGVVATTAAVPENQWVHLAWTYDGEYLRMFIDGVMESETITALGHNTILHIGMTNSYGVEGFSGFIDEVRVIRDAAVYTGNFTPPSAPF